MSKHTFIVSGWTCDGCVDATRRVLSRIEGIRSVDAALEARRVTVDYEGGGETLQQAREAIARAGFDVSEERDGA
ncbi:MAG: copper chaperone [Deltaproteobacteria bacterium]|nr:MAG: copper chaperone [Deltaproteobacteria bacterium]